MTDDNRCKILARCFKKKIQFHSEGLICAALLEPLFTRMVAYTSVLWAGDFTGDALSQMQLQNDIDDGLILASCAGAAPPSFQSKLFK
jgi:hypothetical protein